MAKTKSKPISVRKTQRQLTMAKTAMHVGLKKTNQRLKAALKSQSIAEMKRDQTELAEILFRGLCQLRGTALKLTQALSLNDDFFSTEQIAILQQSHFRVPPLNPVLIRKVLYSEWGANAESLFLEFNPLAIAAASLGQVHRARIQNGNEVAVKIQYPGIDNTISIDVGWARTFLKTLPRNQILLHSLSAFEDRLKEEIDYTIELKNAQFFKEHCTTPRIWIPLVYPSYSNRYIITYEWCQGVHISDWLKTRPDQNKINLIGQTLWNFFFDSFFKLKRLHCDPNIGNFIVTPDYQLAVLDFGAVQTLSEPSIRLFAMLLKPITDSIKTELLATYKELDADVGLSPEAENEFYNLLILPYQEWLQTMTAVPRFDFRNHRNMAHKGQRLLFKDLFNTAMTNFNPEFTIIHRTFFGVLQILELLGAEIETNFHN